MRTVLDFATQITPLIFDQGSRTVVTMTYTDTPDISAWGGRMALYVDVIEVLLELSTTTGGGNGALVLGSSAPNVTATILATDTVSPATIASFRTGSWYLMLDPNGTPDDLTFKAFGGWWQMNPLGPVSTD